MRNIALLQNNGIDIESSIKLLGSMEFYDETLQTFLDDINNKLTKIKNFKEKNDMANYTIEVHSLKNDSKYLGFTKLAEMSYQHEVAGNQNDLKFIYEHYNELIMEAIRIVTITRQYNNRDIVNNQTLQSSKDAIIVADDSNIIRSFINKIFYDEYEILPAIDGNEVIKIIEQNSSKNIVGMLLDLNMPNLNGFGVLDYLKENDLFKKIPVSIITGDDTKDSIDKAFKYPIVDMLNKPFNESDVRRITERTISIHKSI